jgi:hypothetical protein
MPNVSVGKQWNLVDTGNGRGDMLAIEPLFWDSIPDTQVLAIPGVVSGLKAAYLNGEGVVRVLSGDGVFDDAADELTVNSETAIVLRAESPGTSPDLPTLLDEQNAYTAQGLTWTASDHDLYFSSDTQANRDRFFGGWLPGVPGIHTGTEGDDLWMAINQYERYNGIDQTHADEWLVRAQAMRDYFVNSYLVEGLQNDDEGNGFGDHLYGWGLADWITSQGADAAALQTMNDLRAELEGPAYDAFYGDKTPGDDISTQGNSGRRWARWLRFACALVEKDNQAANVTFRDKVADLVRLSPNWETDWPGRGSARAFMLNRSSYNGYDNLDYAGGDRVTNLFHSGLMADGLWQAWRVYNAEGDTVRAADFRAKIIAFADFWLQYNTEAGFQDGQDLGQVRQLNCGFNTTTGQRLAESGYGTGRNKENINVITPQTSTRGIYSICIVNNMVFAYKFTGTQAYLDEAWRAYNLWQKTCQDSAAGSITEINHFADTLISSADNYRLMAQNKGMLQYVYALFENGGSPTLV